MLGFTQIEDWTETINDTLYTASWRSVRERETTYDTRGAGVFWEATYDPHI